LKTGLHVRLDADDETYLIARIVSALFVFGMYLVWLRPALGVGDSRLYFVGVALWLTATVITVVSSMGGNNRSAKRLLFISLPFDLVALAFFVVSTWQYEDPFYAFYVGLAAVYATAFKRSRAWVYSGLFVVSYLSAHLVMFPEMLAPGGYAFVVMKAATIVLLGWSVGLVMEQQSARQMSLEGRSREVVDLNRQLERSVAELQAISEISEVIHSTLDFDSVGPVVIDILQKVIDIPAACIFVIDKAKQQTLFSASKGLRSEGTYSYTGPGLIAEAGLDHDDHFACLELLDHNEMLVVFCADSVHIEALEADDRMVLSAVASELVVAVENSRLYKLTKRLSITDELTDLYNYRYLQQRLDDEIGRARRYSKTLSFLMLDVDDFKAVNDRHGHLVGDVVLAELGQVLKTAVREVDMVARYGGEEFSVLLPETDAAGAFIVAEKIREAVALHRFPDEDGDRTVRASVSIGLANFPVHAEDKESLLKAADDAVYQAKTMGKDRVRAPQLRMTRLGRPTAVPAPPEGESDQ
jgi:diguanylate cyclase (GGDEF)-like protein